MYVAVTRARERLYLSYAQTRMLHGQSRYNLRSRFVEEVPEALLKWLTPQASRNRGVVGDGSHYFQPGRRPEEAARQAPRSAEPRDRDLAGLHVGQNVEHAKFGVGVIVAAEGSGQDARVQVNFGRQGVKWLALSIAKLTPA